jgi:hypothetical protein
MDIFKMALVAFIRLHLIYMDYEPGVDDRVYFLCECIIDFIITFCDSFTCPQIFIKGLWCQAL